MWQGNRDKDKETGNDQQDDKDIEKIMTELYSNLVILLTILIKLRNSLIMTYQFFNYLYIPLAFNCSQKRHFWQICKKRDTIFAFLHESTMGIVPAILGGLSDQEPGYKTNRFRLLKFQFQDRYSKYSIQCVLCCGERIKEALTNSRHPVLATHHEGQTRLPDKQILPSSISRPYYCKPIQSKQ